MTATINVTQEYIDEAYQNPFTVCPVWIAMRAATGRTWGICWRYAVYPVSGARGSVRVSLPPVAQDFIANFDNGLKVRPFSFKVEIPE